MDSIFLLFLDLLITKVVILHNIEVLHLMSYLSKHTKAIQIIARARIKNSTYKKSLHSEGYIIYCIYTMRVLLLIHLSLYEKSIFTK